MKKVLAVIASTTLIFGGLTSVAPANAITSFPEFEVSSYNAAQGTPFHVTLSPIYGDAMPSWTHGSRATLSSSCDALPDGITFTENALINDPGNQPMFTLTGTPAASTAGVYNICFDVESDEEGFVDVGTSQQVTLTVTSAAVDYTIDCQDETTQTTDNYYRPFPETQPKYWVRDINFGGTQAETKYVRVKGCGYSFARVYGNPDNVIRQDYFGTATDEVFRIDLAIDGAGDVWGYNTWDSPVDTTYIINFANYAVPVPGDSANPGCDYSEDYVSPENANAYLEDLCLLAGEVQDAGTNNENDDTFDTFGRIYGINGIESDIELNASEILVNDAETHTYKYITRNVFSEQAQRRVDVVVERKFIGNTLTWRINVFQSGTEIPATMDLSIQGGLGSDNDTEFSTVNGMVVSSDGLSSDPAIVWDTNGRWNFDGQLNEYGNDDVHVFFDATSSAYLQTTLVGFERCEFDNSANINQKINAITSNYQSYVNTNIADVPCSLPTEISTDQESVSEGQDVSVNVSNAIEESGLARFIDGVLDFADYSPWYEYSVNLGWNFLAADLSKNHIVTWRYYSSLPSELNWETPYDTSVSVNWVGSGTQGAPTPPNHFVTFKPNGGDGPARTVGSNSPSKVTESFYSKPGFAFVGWNTKADGTGTAYGIGSELSYKSNMTLFAQWKLVSSKKFVPNFASNKSKLTTVMKKSISKWVKTLPNNSKIVCQGSTVQTNATAADVKLAKLRAQKVCTYAASVRKDISYLVSVKPTATSIAKSRSVWMFFG